MFAGMLPILVGVVLLTGLILEFIPVDKAAGWFGRLVKPDWVRANMERDSGLRGWLMAVVGGILSVGPIYAWYALLRDLKTKGMRTALIAVFHYNRGIKLPLLPLMIHYFGATYTLVSAIYLTLFSLLSSILVEKIVERRPG